MARYKCPSCGRPYNGKRCPECLYERFTEEIAHGNHWHEGEPLVIKASTRQGSPVRRPTPVRSQRDCDSFPGRRSASMLPTVGKLIAVILIFCVLFTVLAIYTLVEAEVDGLSQPEPEPAPSLLTIPEDGTVLMKTKDLLVVADWNSSQPMDDDIRILIRNNTNKTLIVTSRYAAVNSCMSDSAFVYCEAYPGSVSEGTLWLDSEALLQEGIGNVANILLYLDAYDDVSYETYAESGPVILTVKGGKDYVQPMITSGQPLYDEDQILLVYQGGKTNDYDDLSFQFYIRNDSVHPVSLEILDVEVNGESTGTTSWTTLLPLTQSLCFAELYDPDLAGMEEIESLDIHFALWDQTTMEYLAEDTVVSVTP